MEKLELMLNEIEENEIRYIEEYMPHLAGLYFDNTIVINNGLSGIEKACVVAEELGHYYTTEGNILDQRSISNQKQEIRARRWAHNKLVSLSALAEALKKEPRNLFELADLLDVSEDFLKEALEEYHAKYGISVKVDEGLYIQFEPLMIVKTQLEEL